MPDTARDETWAERMTRLETTLSRTPVASPDYFKVRALCYEARDKVATGWGDERAGR